MDADCRRSVFIDKDDDNYYKMSDKTVMLEAHKSLSERFIEVEKKNKFEETKLDVFKNLMDKEAGFISSQIGKCVLYFLPDSNGLSIHHHSFECKNPSDGELLSAALLWVHFE